MSPAHPASRRVRRRAADSSDTAGAAGATRAGEGLVTWIEVAERAEALGRRDVRDAALEMAERAAPPARGDAP